MSKPLRIFVLADTHNRLLPNLADLARDADQIWHLGDVCADYILEEIRAFGPPVVVVRGNCDSNFEWPLVLNMKLAGIRFCLMHIPPNVAPRDADVILHGHTHVPRDEVRNGVRFLNPGCITRPNRGAPRSAARLEISGSGDLKWELLLL